MPHLTRRIFLATAGSLALTQASRAAPFVPARDPQVVAFAPGGTMVATGCSGLSDGKFPPRPHPDVRKCGVVAVWDVATRKRLLRWETFGDFTKLAFSPDGRLLAACRLFATGEGVELDEVRLWDITTGRLVNVLDRCHAFDFSPDSKQLAVLSRSKCIVYDLKEWSKQRQVAALGESLNLAFSADGESLIGVIRGGGEFFLRLARLDAAQPVTDSLRLNQPYYVVAVSPDGTLLATGHDEGNVVVWDAATLDLKSRLQTGTRGLAHPFFSPDGRLLAAGCQETGDTVFWSLADRQEMARYTFEKGALRTYFNRPAGEIFRPERDPTRFCFSPDGESFLAGCYGGILRAVSGGQELARFGE
jgi:WD40 repeat protein